MNTVNGFLAEEHVPFLLEQANRRMQHDLGTIVGDAFPGLRGSHLRLIGMIPGEGTRPSTLAAIAGVTRPALGELVAHLQEHGYVSTEDDPSDRRAIIVSLTPVGRRAAAVVAAAVAQLRDDWAREIGPDRLAAMVKALAALTVKRNRSA